MKANVPALIVALVVALGTLMSSGCAGAPSSSGNGASVARAAETGIVAGGAKAAAAAPAAESSPVVRPTATAAPTRPASDRDETVPSGSATASTGWTDETHDNTAEPNYDVVFPQDKVNRITITIAPDDWAAMQDNMTQLMGAPGTGRRGAAPGGVAPDGFAQPPGNWGAVPDGFAAPQERQQRVPGGAPPQGFQPPDGGMAPGGAGGGRGFDMTPENPMWVPATIEFEGQTWTNVGVRYKGNSSLRSSWGSGTLKLPLKLDFDEFEDNHPEIDNQRFYGFKQLSLASGFGDATYLREAAAYDLLEESGLVAAKTAYYEVYMDHGEGPVRLGLYVVVEVIDDTVVERHFGDDSGNIYEGDGTAASLAQGTFDRIQDSFLKENNEKEEDWSDIEALYNVLHSDEHTTDPTAWRAKLESIFDVDSFLKWLAISAAIGHWDTYGQMSHNYYLYNDPATGRLTWISWDHNLVLGAAPGGAPGGGAMAAPRGAVPPGGGVGGRGNTSLDKANVGANWPLVRYLLDVPDYYAAYVGYLEETVSGPFAPDRMEAKYREMADLVGPYVAQESSEQAFEAAVQSLIQATRERAKAVNDFLATQSSATR